jgi:transaldolase
MSSPLKNLAKEGVSVWLDDLSRPLIQTGDLANMVDNGQIVGITTNPTIFAKACQPNYQLMARHENRACGPQNF